MVDTIIPPRDPQGNEPRGNAHLYHGPLLGPGAEAADTAAAAVPQAPVGGAVTLPETAAAPAPDSTVPVSGDSAAGEPAVTVDGQPQAAADPAAAGAGSTPTPPLPAGTPLTPPPRKRRRWIPFVAGAVGLGLVGLVFAFASGKKPNGIGVNKAGIPLDQASQFASTSVPLDNLPQGSLSIDSNKQLAVNGQLRVNGAFVLTPSGQPTNPIAGQLYFDQTSNQVYYYNGTAFQNLVNKTDIVSSLGSSLGPGLKVVNSQLTNTGLLSNTGVLSFQGQNGNVSLTAGGGITISGTTITNSGVTSLGGDTGNVSVGAGLSAAGGTLSNSGVISLVSGTPSILTVTNDGSGNYTISQTGTGNTVVLGPNSIQTDSTNNPSINFTKTGSGNLLQLAVGSTPTNKFVVDQSGAVVTGTISFGQVTGKPTFVNSVAGGTGALLLGSGLQLGGSTISNTGVLSVAGGTGALLLGSGLQLGGSTINNTGVLSLTGTPNQIVVSAATGNITVNLPQDIAVTSSPTFGGLTLSTTPLAIGSGGTGATSAANARLNLSAARSGANSDITSLSGLTTPLSVAQGGTGVASLPANGQLLIGNGSGYQIANITNSDGKVQIINGPGSIEINVPAAGQCTLCADRSLDNLGGVAINTNLLPQSAGGIDLGSSSLPFKNLYLAGSSLTPGSNNYTITGTATAPRTITLPDATGNVCISTNNCNYQAFGSYVNLQATTPGSAQTGNVNITGTLIAGNLSGTLNGVTLSSSGTSQFTVSGGSPSSRTLTVTGDSSLNQNLLTTSGPTFNSLTLTNALSIGNGGTGVNSTPTNGQLLIGNGSGYTVSTLSTDGTVTITNGAGTIQLSVPSAGSCSSCATTTLNNIGSVAIPTNADLLPASAAGISLGSSVKPVKEIFLAGTSGTPGSNNFKITGVATGGTKVFTLDNLSGTGALVQTAGSSSAQTGDINVNGTAIAGTAFQGTLVKTADSNSTNTSSLTIRSGNTSAGNSGNISIDAGTFSGTGGTITLGGTSASALTVGRAGLQVSIPGGLTTNGSNIASAGGNLNLGSGTITSGSINSQTISSSANLTGTLTIQGASALTLGTASTNTGAIIFKNNAGSNTVTFKPADTNPSSSQTFVWPVSGGTSGQCLESDGGATTVTLTFAACAGGLSGSGTTGNITKFTGSASVGNSLLSESGTVVSLTGAGNSLTVQGTINVGVNGASGNQGIINFLDGTTGAGRTIGVEAQQSGSSYTLQLPTTADVGSTCLVLSNVSAGVNKITGGSCAAGGSGGNITATGGATNQHLVRYTNNGSAYTADASLIQDNTTGIGVNISPQTSYILTVGSGNKFKVTDAGQLEIGTTGSNPLTISTAGAITNITGETFSSGNFDQSASSGTFQTGTGAVTLNGNTTVASGKTFIANGLTVNTDADQTIATANLKSTVTKNDTNTRTFYGVNIQPTFNTGVSNTNTTYNVLNIDTTNTAVTGLTTNLLRLAYGGSQKLKVDSGGNLTVAGNVQVQGLSTAGVVLTDSSGNISSVAQLSAQRGGTGTDTSGSLAGSALLFNATTGKFVANRITSTGNSITTTYGDGTLNLEVNSCSTCANTSLSNLTSVSIQGSSLLTGAASIDLGSRTAPFRDAYIYGSGTYGTDSIKLTTTATGSTKTATFPNATGVVCLDSNNCSYQASGSYVNLQATTPGSAQSGNINVTGAALAGNFNGLTLTQNADGFAVAGGSTSSRTLTVTSSNVTLNQNLRTTDNVTFNNVTANGTLSVTGASTLTGTLTVSTITPPSATALTIGATGSSQTTSVQGLTISFLNGSRTYSFNSASSGSQTICDTSGNCAGSGGGVTTGGGTTNYVTKFTGSQSLGNSVIYDDGTNVEIGGTSPNSLLTLQGTQPGSVSGNGTNATQVFGVTGAKGGNTTGTTGQTAGAGANVAITAGDGGNAGSGSTNGNGGNITLQAGSAGSGAGTAGSAGYIALQASGGNVGIGTTNPSQKLDVQGGSINTSASLMTGGTTRVSSTGALQNITGYTQTSGTMAVTSATTSGSIVSFTNSSINTDASNLANFTFTNANTANSNVQVNGISVSAAGSINSNGNKNTNIALNLATVSPTTGNLFYGINIGTGYNDILRYNGTQLISGTGLLQNAAIDSATTYSNLQKVGALTAGSIASGFGTISTANNISTSANISTTGSGTITSAGVLTVQSGGIAVTGNSTIAGTLGSITNLSLSGTISGGTTYTGSSTINTTGGSIQTNSTDRITNSGALNNITGYTQTSGTSSTTSATTSGNIVSIADASLNTTGATLANLTFTNANASSTATTVSGLAITPTGTTNSNSNANTLNAISLPNVTTIANNAFYGLNVGTGYNDILRYNGTQLISGSGFVQNAAIDSSLTYSNLQKVGALSVGSIASGFGTISTANNITTSANISTTGSGTITSAGALTVSSGGAAITGNSTIAGTLGSITNLSLSGTISGGTTYTGSSTINTTGGAIQTNSTDRITNAGALNNITGYTQTSGTASIASAASSADVLSLSDASINTNNVNLAKLTFTNTNSTSTSTTVNGLSITPTGSTNSNSNANTLNAINLPNVSTVANNNFYGLNVGTGYNDILRYNGTQLISGTGLIQNAAIDSSLTYSNLQKVGTLSAGSITTGFGSISTANNISTTGTGTITSAGLLTGSAGLTVTGGVASLNDNSNNNTSINTGSSTGSVQIGSTTSAVAQTIGIGNNATPSSTDTITIGNLLSTSSTTIRGGTGSSAIALNTGNGGTLSIGANLNSTTIQIGSVASGTTTIQGGSGINIGTANVANTIQIGNTANGIAQTINIGNNATAGSSSTLVIGSPVAGTTTLQSAGGVEVYGSLNNPSGGIGRFGNMLTNSETIGGTGWTIGNGETATQAATTAPDGNTTASKIQNGGIANGATAQTFTTNSTTNPYTFSFWAKSGNSSIISYGIYDGTSLTWVTSGGSVTTGTLTSNWQRFSITGTPSTTGHILVAYFYADSSTSTTSGNYNYVWGAQVVKDSIPETYVRTTSGTVSSDSGVVANGDLNLTGNLNLGGGGSSSTIVVGSSNTTTVGFLSPTANVVYNFDTATAGTYKICTTANTGASGVCAPGAGSGNYIQNSTSTQTANYAIQSAAAGSVAAVIKGAASQSVDILDVATNSANIFTIGSAGAITASAGANFQFTSSTAFQIQTNAGAFTLFNADTSNKLVKVGNGTNTITSSTTGGLFVTDVIEGLNGVKLNGGTIVSTTGQLRYSGAAQNLKTIQLIAEYAGATLTNCALVTTQPSVACAGTDSNVGTMTSGYDATGTNGPMNYYNWTTAQTNAQTYDVIVRVPVPSDWASWGGTNLSISYFDDNNSNTSLGVNVNSKPSGTTLYDVGSSSTFNSVTLGTASQWNTVTYTLTNGNYSADNIFTIRLRLSSVSGANIRLGIIKLQYNSQF